MEANCKEAAKFCELLEFDDSIEVFVALQLQQGNGEIDGLSTTMIATWLQIPLKVFNSTHFPTIR